MINEMLKRLLGVATNIGAEGEFEIRAIEVRDNNSNNVAAIAISPQNSSHGDVRIFLYKRETEVVIFASPEIVIKAFSSPLKGYGNLIIIDHGNQYYSLYAQAAHLNLPVGTVVDQGKVITTSGFKGRDSYYLEIRHGGTPVDPRKWLTHRAR